MRTPVRWSMVARLVFLLSWSDVTSMLLMRSMTISLGWLYMIQRFGTALYPAKSSQFITAIHLWQLSLSSEGF